MGKENGPGINWYRAMNKLTAKGIMKQVRTNLLEKPELCKRLGDKIESFITWAGFERLNYEPDIYEEVNDFIENYFKTRKRLYSINATEWKRRSAFVFKRDHYICQHCMQQGGLLEADHVIPFIKGGSDETENLITSCRTCNRSRRDKSIEEFRLWKHKKQIV